MQLSFINACLMSWSPQEVISFAAEHGFDAIELHGGPAWKAVSWPAVASGDKEAVGAIRDPLERHGLSCPGIMFGRIPFLDPDPSVREAAADQLRTLVQAAVNLGIPLVSTFTGRAMDLDLEGNVKLFAEVFTPLVDEAEQKGVRLAFENCSMTDGFAPARHNIAYAPTIWAELFAAVPSDHLGLTFDPSHLQWMGADVVLAADEFAGRIFHVHAKDAEVFPRKLARTTILADGWWRYRLPGYGQVDWPGLFSVLRSAGYDGAISIEHEDPVFEGSDEVVIDGLRRAAAFLRPYL